MAGDFVWDFDEIKRVVFGVARDDVGDVQRKVLLAMLNAAIRHCASTSMRSWIIITDPEWAQAIADDIGGSVVVMDATREVCIARIKARDPNNQRRAAMVQVIERWGRRGG